MSSQVLAGIMGACPFGRGLIGLLAARGEISDKCGEIGHEAVDIWLEYRVWKQDGEFWTLMGRRGFSAGEVRHCDQKHHSDVLWNGSWPRWYEHWDE
ncbi:MAG: hypothetical protein F4X68_10025 [Acidimicrobiia bacterium]|nr:hypothetical protein [Acidimicrobiia bacterium]MYB74281.1 hypothetical protein [Acidimicrobiia bacterium]